MNAVADALPGGAGSHLDMPVTAMKLWEACRRAEQSLARPATSNILRVASILAGGNAPSFARGRRLGHMPLGNVDECDDDAVDLVVAVR